MHYFQHRKPLHIIKRCPSLNNSSYIPSLKRSGIYGMIQQSKQKLKKQKQKQKSKQLPVKQIIQIKQNAVQNTNITNNYQKMMDQLITCNVCYVCPSIGFIEQTNLLMCPKCQKLYCQNCIQKSLSIKQNCPNCRCSITSITQMNSCSRFLTQAKHIFTLMLSHLKQIQLCPQHNVQTKYFCQYCQVAICCECFMFGHKHKNHNILRLDQKYQQKFRQLRQALTKFRKQMILKEQLISRMHNKMKTICVAKQQEFKEIQKLNQTYGQLIHKQTQQCKRQGTLAILKLQQSQNQLNKTQLKLQTLSTYELQQCLLQLQGYQKTLQRLPLSIPKLVQQLIPPFNSHTIRIKNYSLHKSSSSSIIYSQIIKIGGSEWRLKIYPNGTQMVKNMYLSIFVQMVSSITNFNQNKPLFQFQIQLLRIQDCHRINIQNDSRSNISNLHHGNKPNHDNIMALNHDSMIALNHDNISLPSHDKIRSSNHDEIRVLDHDNKIMPNNDKKRMVKQYRSMFQPGQSWGFTKFIPLANLYHQNFIDNQKDELTIYFAIKNSSFYHIYQNSSTQLEIINSQICQQQKQIEKLKQMIEYKKQKLQINGYNLQTKINNQQEYKNNQTNKVQIFSFSTIHLEQ